MGWLQCRFLEGLLIHMAGRKEDAVALHRAPGSPFMSFHLIPATGTCCCLRILLNSSMYCTTVSAGL